MATTVIMVMDVVIAMVDCCDGNVRHTHKDTQMKAQGHT
jgi:hypothetical protein